MDSINRENIGLQDLTPSILVWLRTGNTRVRQIENTLRAYQDRIEKVVGEDEYGIVEIKGS